MSLLGDSTQVRNTFVHFEEDEDLPLGFSSLQLSFSKLVIAVVAVGRPTLHFYAFLLFQTANYYVATGCHWHFPGLHDFLPLYFEVRLRKASQSRRTASSPPELRRVRSAVGTGKTWSTW